MIINMPRMQNVLLGISAFLLLTLFWSRMCYTVDLDGTEYSIKFTEHIQFLVLSFITFSLCIAAICYKKQYILQIRVCIINLLIWIIVTYFQLKSVYTFTMYTLFPLACIILIVLAIRYSWKDATDVIARDFQRKVGKKIKK